MILQDSFKRARVEIELGIRSSLSRASNQVRSATWPFFGYRQPPPARAKRAVLARYGSHADTWVETGTYFGHTSRWLASIAREVVTIEPEVRLANRATRRLSHIGNVKVVQGYSELILPQVMPSLSGSVSFWLDGHYSGGVTALGEVVTPIIRELAQIESYLNRLLAVSVFVDDFRLFPPNETEDTDYPPRSKLVNWAVKNQLSWTVEHDIFVASTLRLEHFE